VVERLPAKCEALSSNPVLPNKQTKNYKNGVEGVAQAVEHLPGNCEVLRSEYKLRTKKNKSFK
jgi:hypothetical protein